MPAPLPRNRDELPGGRVGPPRSADVQVVVPRRWKRRLRDLSNLVVGDVSLRLPLALTRVELQLTADEEPAIIADDDVGSIVLVRLTLRLDDNAFRGVLGQRAVGLRPQSLEKSVERGSAQPVRLLRVEEVRQIALPGPLRPCGTLNLERGLRRPLWRGESINLSLELE